MNKKYILALGLLLTGSLLGINAYAAMGDGADPQNGPGQERGIEQNNRGDRPMPGQGFETRRPAVTGTITKIDGATITIESISFGKNINKTDTETDTADKTKTPETVTYTIDANKATFYKDGVESKISEIIVGEKIMVEGTVDGTTVTATKVHEGNLNQANFDQNKNVNKVKINNGFWSRIGNFFGRMFGKR